MSRREELADGEMLRHLTKSADPDRKIAAPNGALMAAPALTVAETASVFGELLAVR
jgi:hypothetical protein